MSDRVGKKGREVGWRGVGRVGDERGETPVKFGRGSQTEDFQGNAPTNIVNSYRPPS